MLTLIALLSSAGFGSIVGLFGGIVNRLIDIKARQADRDFELKKLDKEREYMKDEYASRLQITVTESQGKVEEAAYHAMGESYNFAATTSEDGVVDKISKIIRPLLTLSFFVFTIYVFYQINSLMLSLEITPSTEQILKVWVNVIEWIFFQAGVTIGWWFAMRPGKMSIFK